MLGSLWRSEYRAIPPNSTAIQESGWLCGAKWSSTALRLTIAGLGPSPTAWHWSEGGWFGGSLSRLGYFGRSQAEGAGGCRILALFRERHGFAASYSSLLADAL
jgi:hypothetical protein